LLTRTDAREGRGASSTSSQLPRVRDRLGKCDSCQKRERKANGKNHKKYWGNMKITRRPLREIGGAGESTNSNLIGKGIGIGEKKEST